MVRFEAYHFPFCQTQGHHRTALSSHGCLLRVSKGVQDRRQGAGLPLLLVRQYPCLWIQSGLIQLYHHNLLSTHEGFMLCLANMPSNHGEVECRHRSLPVISRAISVAAVRPGRLSNHHTWLTCQFKSFLPRASRLREHGYSMIPGMSLCNCVITSTGRVSTFSLVVGGKCQGITR